MTSQNDPTLSADALRESEERLRTAFDQAAVGLAHTDVEGRYIRLNAKFCEIVGYAPEELVGCPFQRITHPDDVEENVLVRRQCLAGTRPTYSLEKRYICKDGTIVWVNLAVSLVRDERGEPLYFLAVVEDITARKRAQEALRESEQRLSLALKIGKLGSWELDLANDILTTSEESKANFGLPPNADFTYAKALWMVHPKDREMVVAALARVRAAGGNYNVEYRNIWPDGSIHWIMVRGQPICGSDGKPTRLVGVSLDTTERKCAEEELHRLNDALEARVGEHTQQLKDEIDERKRAEAALRASEERYAAFFQYTTAGIIMVAIEPGGRFRFETINPAQERATGIPAAQYVGASPHDLFPPEVADRLIERYCRCIETGVPLAFEDELPFPTGMRHQQVTLVPIRNSEGQISKLLLSIHDVTDRKKVEEALQQGQKMEAIGQLTGGVAHDFNNLLTAVLGNLELLGRRVEDPQDRKLVQGAMRAAERGAKLTQQLLAFARRQRLESKPVDLGRLIVGMRDMLLSAIGATIRIDVVLAKGLWPAMVDVSHVELVLLNLAINARDAMPDGGVLTITAENLRVTSRNSHADLAPGDYVMLSMQDTGTGMSEDVKAKAFEPFFTTKEVGKGSGLGLSQVYGVARQLGGSAAIESGIGSGTTIRVCLPRARQPATELAREFEPSGLPAREQARILVVDDDRDVRELVTSCLMSLGYEVVEASDAKSALDRFEQDSVDLLLADFAMPEMNGVELARQARQRRPRLKVLFMTGFANTTQIDAQMRGIPIMRKPFKLNELSENVRAALSDASP